MAGAALALLGLLVCGAVAWWTARQTDLRMRADLLNRARLAAQAIKPEDAASLTGSPADLDSPGYLRLKERLALIRQAAPDCRFVYLLGRREDGTVFFHADAEPAGSKDESPAGQVYDEASPELQAVFTQGVEGMEGPIQDRWGAWISASIPLRTPGPGGRTLVFGMDIDARHWRRDVLRLSSIPAALLAVALLAGALSTTLLMSNRSMRASRLALEDRSAFQRVLAGVSSRFVELSDLDDRIRDALSVIGGYAGVDRSYVFLRRGNSSLLDNTHEWCAPGIPTHKSLLQGLPFHRFPWGIARLQAGEVVNLAAISELPPAAQAERELLRSLDARSVLIVPMNVDGRLLGFLGFDSVRTPRVWAEDRVELLRIVGETFARAVASQRAELALRHSQKMESVGRLAGGVAHDFNNLLMGIMGYVDLCRDALPENHPVQAYLNEVIANAERSANRTRQLLAFARKQTIAPRVIDLNTAVVALLPLLQRLLGEGVRLTWQPGKGLGRVKIDRSQLEQLLVNLTANARDAVAGAGEIQLETTNVTLDEAFCAGQEGAIPGEYVLLSVRDNGCGMDEETLSHVFEPFFTTKGMGKGSGLGLAIVFGIVQQNQGVIQIHSAPRRGTTVRVHLPRAEEPLSDEPAVRAPARKGGAETILLAEDEQSLRTTTRMLLEGLGYKVLSARDPEQALALAEDFDFDIHLLLSDVVMPGGNGPELAQKLKETRPRMRCIFMSGYTDQVVAEQGGLGEGVPFLAKPCSRDVLAAKVREVLDAPAG